MAKKIKLTRPELKRFRDAMERYERFLPTLKLKQQQLQMWIRQVESDRAEAGDRVDRARRRLASYDRLFRDYSGVDLKKASTPTQVVTGLGNIAGVRVPTFIDAVFEPIAYSLFATPAWVDRALADMKDLSLREARLRIVEQQHGLLHRELTRIVQRVNLFEKVKIPESREAIRRIRIALGDEMTAGVVRAKIAKTKLAQTEAHAISAKPTGGAAPDEAAVT